MSDWTGGRLVTLLTDFGHASSYPGSLRGALLSTARDLTLADITHDVPAFDVMAAALILRDVVPAFPPGTVHLAVIDPGVGSARRAVALRSGDHAFVGPDNGLFTPFLGPDAVMTEIDPARVARGPVTATFHGRDLFAPAAARIAAGLAPEEVGPRVETPVRLPWPEPREAGGAILGAVIHVDAFGNLITNIDRERLGARGRVLIADALVTRVRTYSDVPAGTLVALIGSGGLLEVAESQGSAAARLGVKAGEPVRVLS